MINLTDLPGGERAERGLRDLAAGRHSLEALWLTIASRRLRELGLPLPPPQHLAAEPELALYEILRATIDDAYARYNALLQELSSFISALQTRARRLAVR
jgi:hypothetical protein